MSLAVTGLNIAPAPLNISAKISFLIANYSLNLVVGPNGAGKTTLLSAIAGLSSGPGKVTLNGRFLKPADFAYLPASREAPFPISARDIVALGLPRPDPEAVNTVLSRTDTAHLAHRPLTRLSTGERARVLLARALVARPALLLLDEPTSNLDPAHALLVIQLLREEAARGAIVLASTHDLALARAYADRILVIHEGSLVADGEPFEALRVDTLESVFAVRDLSSGFELF